MNDNRKTKAQLIAELEALRARAADLEAREAAGQRAQQVQAALYRIAEAASKVQDMPEFYAAMHRIVGELMYARNFFIGQYDAATEIISFPYFVDEVDEPQGAQRLTKGGLTAYVIRTGQPYHDTPEKYDALIAQGEVERSGSDSLDWLGVPLATEGRTLGALVVQSYTPGITYTDDDLDLLAFVGQAIAAALERARLQTETRQRKAELEIISSVQQGLAAQLDIQAIYDLVGDKVGETFEADTTYIALLDRASGLVHWPYYVEKGQRQKQEPVSGGTGLTGRVLASQKPLVFGAVSEWMAAGAAAITSPDSEADLNESYLGVPILVAGEVTGVVSVQSYRQHAYGEAEVRLLSTLAASMSVALENARLFDETQRLFRAEQQRAAELAILNGASEAMVRNLDVKAVGRIVGDKVREVFQADVTEILLYDSAANLIRILYSYDRGYGEDDANFPMGDGLTSLVIRSRRPLVFGTYQAGVTLGAIITPDAIGGAGFVEAYMGVPMIVGDKVLGVVSVQSYRPYDFDDNSVRLLTTLSSNMGVAIENARLFDETRRLLAETQQRNAELAVINSVQQGLAAKLDFQGTVDLVGDKLREVFQTGEIGIRWHDPETNVVHYLYEYEHGVRLAVPPRPVTELSVNWNRLLATRRPIVVNTHAESEALGILAIPGTDSSRSMVTVPITGRDRVLGSIVMENYERDYAFAEADVRLLSTVAASMGVALENARLFGETQRLLAETEQRAAELAIINSVQQGLAAKLDFQGTVDLVGDKLREIFQNGDIGIRWYDPEANLMHYLYEYEHGVRLYIEPALVTETSTRWRQINETRQPVIANTRAEQVAQGGTVIPGTDPSKSSLIVPIIGRERVLGTIVLENYEQEYAYSEADVRLLSTVAASLGTALENARLFAETQRLLAETQQRAAELAIINGVQEGLAAQLDIQAIYDLVGDNIRDTFKADTTYIALLDRAAQQVQFTYYVDRGERLHIDLEPVGTGLTSLVLQSGRPLLLANQAQAQAHGVIPDASPGAEVDLNESYLGVPMHIGGEVVGVISVQSYRQNAYGEAEVRLLSTLAATMSAALENARLFGETQRLLAETQQRAAELAIINSVQHGLAAQLNIQAIYDLVGDNIRETFQADSTYIALVDRATHEVRFHYHVDAGERVENVAMPPGSGLAGAVIRLGRPLILANQDEQQMHGVIATASPGAEVDLNQSYVGVPIMIGNEVGGVVSVQSYRQNAYSEADARLLSTLAATMSAALENARLFDETQRLLAETVQRAAELAIINSIQQGLASKLNFQGTVDLVGDKLREVFQNGDIGIRWYEPEADLIHYLYEFEHGVRLQIPSAPPVVAPWAQLLEISPPLVYNTPAEWAAAGVTTVPGTDASQSMIRVQIVGRSGVVGSITLENYEREHAYGESEIRLLSTVAASMGVALENARLFDETQRLLGETQQRNAELAVINSIQQGLAAKLDFQGTIDLVGDKLREVFNTGDIGIRWRDTQAKLTHYLYEYEHGVRLEIAPVPFAEVSALAHKLNEIRQPIVTNTPAEAEALGIGVIPGTDSSKSMVTVPILGGDQVLGSIILENYEHEYAFAEADVRLLFTVASSMAVALENARLFDETQRLLAETEQRAAELAIINSVQQGLAAQLDIQAIYDLVGDKVREIFDAQAVAINAIDHPAQLVHKLYLVEKGVRYHTEPVPLTAIARHIIRTGQPLFLNNDIERRVADLGLSLLVTPGTLPPKSALFVPLVSGREVRGWISLQNVDRENAFKDSDVGLLSTLAASLSVALENANLFDETQRLLAETKQRNAELAIISSVQQGLAAQLDIQAIYDLVGDKIREIFDAQVVILMAFDVAAKMRYPRYLSSKGERLYYDPLPFNELAEYLSRTRQIVVINDKVDERSAELGLTPVGTGDAESMAFVPLLVGGETRGYISLQHLDRPNAFGEADVRLLTTVASSMSVALENARLFDETQHLLKQTEQRAAELAIINSVQEALASKLEMQAVYDLVGDKIRDIFDAQVVDIALLDRTDNLLHFPYTIERGVRFPDVAIGVIGFRKHVMETRQTLMINEKAVEASAEYGNPLALSGEVPKSLLFVALMIGNEARGVISLQNLDREHAFSDSDVGVLQTLASSMSVALENARLFDEGQRLLADSEQRAAELSTVNTVSQALASELELDALMEVIGEQVRDIFKADIAYVALHDEATGMINFPYGYGDEFAPMRFGEGLTSRILESGQPLLINRDMNERVVELQTQRVGTLAASYLGVPILAGKQAIGVISVQSTAGEGRFAEPDVRLLTTLAANVGVAIQNARLYAETQRRAEEMATLAEIGSDIAASRELEPVLERIAAHAKALLRVRDIAINLLEGDELIARVALGTYTDEIKAHVSKMGHGLTGQIALSGVAELINYPTQDPRAVTVPGTPEEDNDTEGMMIAPLISRGHVIGTINVWRPHADGLFTQAELDFLVSVARQAAIAIESARLYLETQRRATEMAALAEVGRDVSATLDSVTVMERIAVHACDLLHADTSAVFLPDAAGRSMRAIAAVGELAEALKADTILLGEGIIGQLAQQGQAEFVNDTATDPRAVNIPGVDEDTGIIERLMVAPLLSGDRVTGMMCIWRRGPSPLFTPADLEFLSGLARQAAIAIENARLFAEAQRRAAETTALAEISREISASLDLPTVLEQLASRANQVLRTRDVVLRLLEPDGSLPVVVAYGQYPDRYRATTLRLGEGITGHVAQLGVAELVNDPMSDPRISHVPGTNEEREAIMFAPLKVRENVIGVLGLWRDKVDQGEFTQSDLDFAIGLSQQAAVAIENARLFAEAEKRLGQQMALREASMAVSSSLDIKYVLNALAEQMGRAVGATSAYISTYDHARQTAVVAADYYGPEASPAERESDLGQEFHVPTERPSFVPLLASGLSLQTNIGDADLPAADQATMQKYGAQSVLTVAIRTGDQVNGFAEMWESRRRREFTPDEVALCESLAQQAAVAIENARLYAESQRQKQYIEAVISNIPDAVMTLDDHNDVMSWNPGAERLFGYTPAEALGKNLDNLVAATQDILDEALGFTDKLTARQGFQAITRRTRKDGTLIDVEVQGVEMTAGGAPGGLVIYHDISELQQARRAAEEARAGAEEANKAKSTFLANMSHELRTPLNAIIGFTRIVRRKGEGALPGKQLENLDKVLTSAEHLLGLINTVLDIAKIEAGRMDVVTSNFDAAALAEGCANTAGPLVKAGVTLVKDFAPGVPQAHTDQDKVKQIVLNLLSNAAKFTHAGTITVRVSPAAQPDRLSIAVSDSGIGISPEALGRVFEEFQQADTSTTRQYGGTGLGLSISRSLARLLGGDLTASSVLGEGSTFTLEIPVRYGKAAGEQGSGGVGEKPRETELAPASQPASQPEDHNRRLVLAIDDDPDVAYLLQENLGDNGYRVVAASSGDEGIEQARRLKPFAITLDIMMPGKDGWQVLHDLRADPETRHIPVILLTIVDKKPLGYQLGATDYLLKPFEADDVLAALGRLTQANGGQPVKHLLVVDDDPNVPDMVRQLLPDGEYEIESAADGAEALEAIARRRPQAILLDLMMPRLDGFSVLDRLRQTPETASIPVVVLTAKTLTAEEAARVQESVAQVLQKQGLDGASLARELEKALAA